MSAKQKIVHGRGPSNINREIFVCSFDVCRVSQPFPSINYGDDQWALISLPEEYSASLYLYSLKQALTTVKVITKIALNTRFVV